MENKFKYSIKSEKAVDEGRISHATSFPVVYDEVMGMVLKEYGETNEKMFKKIQELTDGRKRVEDIEVIIRTKEGI